MWNKSLPSHIRGAATVVMLIASMSLGAQADQHSKVVGDVAIHLGVMPAEIVRGRTETPAESTMHGGAPKRGFKHVVVALFDAKSGKRLTPAEVKARVGELGLSVSEKRLEPMTIAGEITYGNFFPMAGAGPYRIEIEIRRSPTAQPIRAEFEYRHADR